MSYERARARYLLRQRIRLLAVRMLRALLLVPLLGCAGPYVTTQEPTSASACVTVQWSDQLAVRTNCGPDTGGCYREEQNLIYAPRPLDFNDENALTILGHEFYHRLGARHQQALEEGQTGGSGATATTALGQGGIKWPSH